jgi:serine/threonine protein kinase/tetratricopeptide (TPR) repeat protein
VLDKDVPTRPRGSLPEKIGRYRILRSVGRGAIGIVYAANDEAMDRVVAVKVLIADLEASPDTRARFHREAQAAARLVHPNIITIFDAGEDQGRPFIVMQLLEGWPFADYLKRPEAATLDRKLDLMIQICEGLAAAHGQGVIHRDLKPNNLFVQDDGLLKIYDFGVARIAESKMTVAGDMLGTPDYMSPEQARGEQVDGRSDIFSAGSVFYFMLAGHKPFPGRDLPAVLHKLQFEEPASLTEANVPPELSAIVLHAMAKKAADRPQQVQELLAGLARFRRSYHAETRRLTFAARGRFEDVETLSAAVVQAGSALGLAVESLESTWRDRHSLLSTGSGTSVDAASIDRATVTAVLHELEAERERLTSELDSRRGYAAQLDAGLQLLAAGDARGALRQFEVVAVAFPSGARARELADACRGQAREQEARDRRVSDLTGEARRALDTGQWALVVAKCEEALALSPRHELASSLLIEAQQAVLRERRRQEQMIQGLADRAALAIDRGDFRAAETALKEAELVQPRTAAIGQLRHRLTEAQAAAEAAELLRQMAVDEIRRARAAFRRGRYDEAVQQLHAFLDVEPQAREAEAELERLVSLRRSLASSAASRHEKALGLLKASRALADQGHLPEALSRVRDAMRTDPVDLELAAAFDDLLERQLRQQIAEVQARASVQRSAEADAILSAAKEAFARGYLAVAAGAAAAACRIAPARADAVRFADDVRLSLDADDAEAVTLADTPLLEAPAELPQVAASPAAKAAPTLAVPAPVTPIVAPTVRPAGQPAWRAWLAHILRMARDLLRGRPKRK